jgi:hypothetical protein
MIHLKWIQGRLPIPTHLQVLPIHQQPTNSSTPSHMVFLDPTVLRWSVDIRPGKPVIINPTSAQEPCCARFNIGELSLSDLTPPTDCGHHLNSCLDQCRADRAAGWQCDFWLREGRQVTGRLMTQWYGCGGCEKWPRSVICRGNSGRDRRCMCTRSRRSRKAVFKSGGGNRTGRCGRERSRRNRAHVLGGWGWSRLGWSLESVSMESLGFGYTFILIFVWLAKSLAQSLPQLLVIPLNVF